MSSVCPGIALVGQHYLNFFHPEHVKCFFLPRSLSEFYLYLMHFTEVTSRSLFRSNMAVVGLTLQVVSGLDSLTAREDQLGPAGHLTVTVQPQKSFFFLLPQRRTFSTFFLYFLPSAQTKRTARGLVLVAPQ